MPAETGTPAGIVHVAERQRRTEQTHDLADDGIEAQGLVADRLEVGRGGQRRGRRVVPQRRQLGDQPVTHRRRALEPVDRPGERDAGRLVSREDQRQELVADLAIAHRAAVVVARAQHEAEDVVAAAVTALARRRAIAS